jgi:hypothetical protein
MGNGKPVFFTGNVFYPFTSGKLETVQSGSARPQSRRGYHRSSLPHGVKQCRP